VQFRNGERRHGEITHPVPIAKWSAEDVHEMIHGLLRVLCVEDGQTFEFLLRWDGPSVLVEVSAENGLVRLVELSIPIHAIRQCIGHGGVMPQRGECRHAQVFGATDNRGIPRKSS
jgi:hypothetical protein